MNKCLNCGKPIAQEDKTRREKKYCSDSCRAIFNKKKNAGKKKYVRIETYQALQSELDKVKKQVEENNKPENKRRIEEERNKEHKVGGKHKPPLTEKEMINNPYGFDENDKWFFAEKYTKHPQKDIPLNKIDMQRWMREKTYSDNEIKKAWHDWKKQN